MQGFEGASRCMSDAKRWRMIRQTFDKDHMLDKDRKCRTKIGSVALSVADSAPPPHHALAGRAAHSKPPRCVDARGARGSDGDRDGVLLRSAQTHADRRCDLHLLCGAVSSDLVTDLLILDSSFIRLNFVCSLPAVSMITTSQLFFLA